MDFLLTKIKQFEEILHISLAFAKNMSERKDNMKYKNNKSSKFIGFLNGKAFYAVLVLCFLGIGIAAWSGIQGLRSLEEPKENNSSLALPSIPADTTNDEQNDPVVSTPEDPDDDYTPTDDLEEPEDTTDVAGNSATYFVAPVIGNIIKGYSDTELQYSLTCEDMRIHKAIDIAAAAGTPVVSAGKGTVLEVKKDALLGSYVLIDHGNGIKAKYCGLNETPSVSVGDSVDSSTQIGTIDVIPSESVEERHLHIEVTQNDVLVSPLKFLGN